MENKREASASKPGGNGNPVGSVMVVGGGVAGIQASLDMADSGFYVYMVEKTSAIGGVMSQLDKTFPTNDCSMCIISPKLVEAGRHRNIELLTLTELTKLEGEAGRLKATLVQQPRYIDAEKCTSCGDCVGVCPVELPNEFDEGLGFKKAAYKRYPQAVPGTYAIEKIDRAPCGLACPSGINVQGYVALIKDGKHEEAIKLIREDMPFPGILGRVCTHPCEVACRRKDVEEPIAICELKRFAADQVDLASLPDPEIEYRDEKVAIIGSGPAGLSCAYFLAREGYRSTVFEALPVTGGMLRVGIPAYRLPRDILDAEIAAVERLGVEIMVNSPIDRENGIDKLFEVGYKAVFIGVGAHKGFKLNIPGEDDYPQVKDCVEYLREINLAQVKDVPGRVVTIGGGYSAIDCARVALRMGASESHIVYRRTQAEMPASHHEVVQAMEEGVQFHFLVAPIEVEGKDGKLTGLKCIRTELGEPDATGRRKPVPIEGSEYVIECDHLVPAISQEPDLDFLDEKSGVEVSKWNLVKLDPANMMTAREGVFAGGDAVTGAATVIEAVGAAKVAAQNIVKYIRGEPLPTKMEDRAPIGEDWTPIDDSIPRAARAGMPTADPVARRVTFGEVNLAFSEEDARAEAARCLDCGICCECFECVRACLAGAVDHTQQIVEREVEVGGVILAPGANTFDPTVAQTYLYGQHPNVVTSLEFERILSASGPYMGHLQRPSDGKEPERIAWIQCVGSRNINACDNGYCSGVCCMYAVKEAIVAKEHSPSIDALDTTIFFMDMRTYGKDFEKYYNRAQNDYGVKFVRSRVHTLFPVPETEQLRIDYATEDGGILSEVFDMVVLSVGLEIGKETLELAENLGVEVNHHRFAKTDPFEPVSTSRSGVYTCGVFQGPKDIPGSVTEASAAAAGCAQNLGAARGTLVTSKEVPPEIDVAGEEPRIGVFVCNCGINIGSVVDVPAVAEYAKSLPYVVYTGENLFTCSQDTQEAMKEVIKEHKLNRMVVAACSPRTHEPLFRETLVDCGVNKYLFDMANIRDQDSWVHQSDPGEATEKAKDLVRMAVARAAFLRPLKESPLEINQRALVVGGGVAGLNAALSIARQGFDAVVVEKNKELGGLARKVQHTIEGLDVQAYLDNLVREVEAHENIQVFTDAQVVGFGGYKGNFTTEIKTGENGDRQTIDHGATVVATGAHEYKPTEYLYGEDQRVMTQLELGEKLAKDRAAASGWNQVVMIQCVGSRNEENPNCSRVCCQGAIKHALELKELNEDLEVTVLYRDIRMYGFLEDYYQEAREKGVTFARYSLSDPPLVASNGDGLSVTFRDHVLDRPIQVAADTLILSAATIPNNTEDLATLLKVPRDADGYFIEAHAKLRPVDFSSDGIYLCGTAHSPKLITESIGQALAAAARAGSFLAATDLTIGGVVAQVDGDRCAVCLTCVRTCPYGVPYIGEDGYAVIDEASCQGCGACVAECPGKAIMLQHFTDDQLVAKSRSLFAS